MAIYLHELVETAPGRTEEYLDRVAEYHGLQASRANRKDTVVGLWTALEATGVWPLAINLWQYGTWADLAAALARQFEPRSQSPELKEWWLRTLEVRTGGVDRVLESAPYSPEIASLREGGFEAHLFLHQIVTVRAGTAGDYLRALGQDGLPAIESAGGRILGAYRVRLRDDEAVTILTFLDPPSFAAFQEAWHAESSRLGRWRRREETWVEEKQSWVAKARHFLGSPWHP